jgi:hypothetical protein
LAALDIAAFDPKAPPPETQAFWDIVDANRAPEDSELADVLDGLGNREAVTVRHIISGGASPEFARLATGPKELASDTSSVCAVRICTSEKPSQQTRVLEDRRPTTGCL